MAELRLEIMAILLVSLLAPSTWNCAVFPAGLKLLRALDVPTKSLPLESMRARSDLAVPVLKVIAPLVKVLLISNSPPAVYGTMYPSLVLEASQ
jgi:hypothetical protein